MEKLDTHLEELLEAVKGEGEPVRFSPEEQQECLEKYRRLCVEEGRMEAVVRKERMLSASAPPVYLTF